MKKRFQKGFSPEHSRISLKHSYFVALLIMMQIMFISCKKTAHVQTSEAEISYKVPETIADPSAPVVDHEASVNTAENDEDIDFEECFKKSRYTLPYSRTTDYKKATYETLPCEIDGVEEFLCNNRGLRYISLPKFNNVDVVLVPMDCADFEYRYILLTTLNKKVVSNLYVEGEWYEPGDEGYKEISTFTIDANYRITVTTNSTEKGKTSLKEKLSYQLMNDGKLKKV
ncbi:MAG TPA: hypothetical protein VF581_01125 [Flavobacterium sp.]|jgi:hypothetical protein